MIDFVISVILILLVGAAVFYIYKSKKSGKKCVGCPYAESCNSKQCKK